METAPDTGAVFLITAERCPQVVGRLVGLFSQQDRLIDRIDAVDTKRILRVSLSVSGLDTRRASIIAEKMRQLVKVRTVKLTT